MGLTAVIIALILGTVFGSIAALMRNKLPDRIIVFLSTLFTAVPSFVLATLLLLVFAIKLGWFPVWSANSTSYTLPVIALCAYPMAYTTRLAKTSMLDALSQDYIRTERSKGVPEFTVIGRYAFKNSVLPVVTYVGPMIATLITGTFVIEQLFSIPGLGRYYVSAITDRDYSVTLGLTIFVGALIIVCNIVVDILYAVLDPRVKITK